MTIPQPFQYQGSKRSLAPKIIPYLPKSMERLIEPFAGSGALSLACAGKGLSREYWLNDFNKPLSDLLRLIVNNPEDVSDFYLSIWRDKEQDHIEQYYSVREEFNRTSDPKLLLYLLARCVKGSVRYNSQGLFNQSPDKRRLGTHPTRMHKNIISVSMLLRGKTIFTSQDYFDTFIASNPEDVIYMDPPYQGVCGARDQRYSNGIEFERFVTGLDELNKKGIRYLVSYDGRLGDKSYGEPLPGYLDLILVEIEAGRSSQATLLGRDSVTVESLYLSRPLADEIGASATYLARSESEQMALLEEKAKYGKVS